MTIGSSSRTSLQVISFTAGDGECLLLRCHADTTAVNILIDGGRASAHEALARYLASIPVADRGIDLFVITHVDSDHIEGALRILRDAELRPLVKDVWFNDARCAVRVDGIPLSTDQGDELSDLLAETGLPPNRHFGGGAVMIRGTRDDTVSLGKHTTLRVIGPNKAALRRLADAWPIDDPEPEGGDEYAGAIAMGDETPDVEALANSAYRPDASVTNRSSITLVLRHGPMSVLLASDAWAEDLVEVLEADDELRRTTFALATLPHHGSRSNMSPTLARLVDAKQWLASTDGSRGHHHPHAQAIARVLRYRPGGDHLHIVFNSRHPESLQWEDSELMSEHRYSLSLPSGSEPWIAVSLSGEAEPTIS